MHQLCDVLRRMIVGRCLDDQHTAVLWQGHVQARAQDKEPKSVVTTTQISRVPEALAYSKPLLVVLPQLTFRALRVKREGAADRILSPKPERNNT